MKIDKGIPLIPKKPSGRSKTAIWKDFAVGDSAFFPNCVQAYRQRTAAKERVITTSMPKEYLPGTQWATRSVTENGVSGLRIWRTK